MVALIDLVVGLIELVSERIDLDHRIARRWLGLYAVDVPVSDARHLTAEVRTVALTDARRRSAEDPSSYKTGLYHEQPLVQSDDALAIYPFDTEAQLLVLVDAKLKEPPDSPVVQPRSLSTGFLLGHLGTASSCRLLDATSS